MPLFSHEGIKMSLATLCRPGQLQSGPKCILCGNKFARGGPGRLIFTPECILDVTELTSRLLLISEDCQPVML